MQGDHAVSRPSDERQADVDERDVREATGERVRVGFDLRPTSSRAGKPRSMTRKSTFLRSQTHMTSEFGDRNGCGLSGMTKPYSLWSLEAATYGASTRSLPLLRTLRRLSPTTIDTMCRDQNLQGALCFERWLSSCRPPSLSSLSSHTWSRRCGRDCARRAIGSPLRTQAPNILRPASGPRSWPRCGPALRGGGDGRIRRARRSPRGCAPGVRAPAAEAARLCVARGGPRRNYPTTGILASASRHAR